MGRDFPVIPEFRNVRTTSQGMPNFSIFFRNIFVSLDCLPGSRSFWSNGIRPYFVSLKIPPKHPSNFCPLGNVNFEVLERERWCLDPNVELTKFLIRTSNKDFMSHVVMCVETFGGLI